MTEALTVSFALGNWTLPRKGCGIFRQNGAVDFGYIMGGLFESQERVSAAVAACLPKYLYS
jgi:hypothetical protein